MPKKPGQDPAVPGTDPTILDASEQPQTPAEKARALVSETRKKKTAEAERQAAEEQEAYEGMKEKHAELGTQISGLQTTRDQLKEALAVFSEMDPGEMTDEIRSEMADYEDQIDKIDLTLARHAAEQKDLAESPLFVRLQGEEQKRETANRIKESKAALEKRHEEATRELQALAGELEMAVKNWEEQLAETDEITRRQHTLWAKFNEVRMPFSNEAMKLIEALPDGQQRTVFDILRSSSTGGFLDFTHKNFERIEQDLKPSIFPFLDKPLKAFLALRKDPRINEMGTLRAQQESANEAYAKARNKHIDFATQRVRRLMMESPLLSSIKESSEVWRTLSFSEVPEGHVPQRQEAWQKIARSVPFLKGMGSAVGYGEDAALQADFLNRVQALELLALQRGK